MRSGARGSQSCSRCRNHGFLNSLKGHKKACLFRNCSCEKCLVTKDRQRFIAKEIANHRHQEKSNSSSYLHQSPNSSNHVQIYSAMYEEISDDNSAEISVVSTEPQRALEMKKEQTCAKCRNHGILQLLKGHKATCPFNICECVKCVVTSRRREAIGKQMKHIHDTKNIESPSSFESLTSEPDVSSTPDFENLCIQQFEYELQGNNEIYEVVPEETQYNDDVFFMIQSLFDKYACQGTEQKIQLIAAFTELANFNWQNIESALEKGEKQKTQTGLLSLHSMYSDSTYVSLIRSKI